MPSVARVYDYALGGKDSFAVDRQAFARLLEVVPDARQHALEHRAFVLRAVQVMAEAGIEQFLDLGTGLPRTPSIDDIARQSHPHARVAYVDHDPMVLTHLRALLATRPGITALDHDITHPHTLLTDPTLHDPHHGLDLTRPLGLLATGVLATIPDTTAPTMLHTYRDALAPGSMLALTAPTHHHLDNRQRHAITTALTPTPLHLRSPAQIHHLLHGYHLLTPGLTPTTHWRHHGPHLTTTTLAAIGEKR